MRDQLSLGQPRGFFPTLGADQLTNSAQPFRQGLQLVRGQGLFGELALNDLMLLLREKLPRFVAAGSTLLEIERRRHRRFLLQPRR
jgi:hypothetical protein